MRCPGHGGQRPHVHASFGDIAPAIQETSCWSPSRDGSIRSTGTTHGSAFPQDTHVPALFLGAGVPHGETYDSTFIRDIAPTVAQIMDSPYPNGTTGRPIADLLNSPEPMNHDSSLVRYALRRDIPAQRIHFISDVSRTRGAWEYNFPPGARGGTSSGTLPSTSCGSRNRWFGTPSTPGQNRPPFLAGSGRHPTHRMAVPRRHLECGLDVRGGRPLLRESRELLHVRPPASGPLRPKWCCPIWARSEREDGGPWPWRCLGRNARACRR